MLLFQQKTNNLDAGSSSWLHKWETGREGGREALRGVHHFVNFMVYYFELFGTL